MPHDVLTDYLWRVESAVGKMKNLFVEHYVEEILTPERANLRLRLRFTQGCLLEINEAIILEDDQLMPLDYRYHFQDSQNQLIFRYDNTPHFPDLPSFPHHKHLPDKIIAAERPSIFAVLSEAETDHAHTL